MRVLMVVPRYGDVVGGAERAAAALIHHAGEGLDVEVATTCAADHHTWRNTLASGTSRTGATVVHRFPISVWPSDPPASRQRSYLDAVRSLAATVWSEQLHRFLARELDRFDLALFTPYLVGTTFWGAQVDPGRSALIPCLHDEPPARAAPMRTLLETVRGNLFNSHAEQRLARRLAPANRGWVVGVGIDQHPPLDPGLVDAFRRRRSLHEPYLVFCGRLEHGKRVDVLVDLVARYRSERGRIDLVLAGEGPYRSPAWVRRLGVLPEAELRAAYAGAVAFVSASRLESLSLVQLEAMREQVPTIVDARCDPMADHVSQSGAGATYASFAVFAEAVDRYRDPDRRRIDGAKGRSYVADAYAWPVVRRRFRAAIDALAA